MQIQMSGSFSHLSALTKGVSTLGQVLSQVQSLLRLAACVLLGRQKVSR